MSWDTCPECGQFLPEPLAEDCICGHPMANHNIAKGRRKSECSRFGPGGKCPCESYRPLEVPGA